MSRARDTSSPGARSDKWEAKSSTADILREHRPIVTEYDYGKEAIGCGCGDRSGYEIHLAALLDAAPLKLGERCPDCGPGYRIGDDGCRHGAAARRDAAPDREHPDLRRLREHIERAVEQGYTEGDVNHNLQWLIGHLRLMLNDDKTPDREWMQAAVAKMGAACDAETAWLNTPLAAALVVEYRIDDSHELAKELRNTIHVLREHLVSERVVNVTAHINEAADAVLAAVDLREHGAKALEDAADAMQSRHDPDETGCEPGCAICDPDAGEVAWLRARAADLRQEGP